MFNKFATLCLVVALTQAVQLEADLELDAYLEAEQTETSLTTSQLRSNVQLTIAVVGGLARQV